jgi:signal transduction histidine kinase
VATAELADKMKRKLSRLSRRYRVALREYLRRGPRAGLQSARSVGRQAVGLGLETLDMTRIHENALAALAASGNGNGKRNGISKPAEVFFAEAVTPIEKTHYAAVKASARLSQVNKRLDRRAVDLAASNRALKKHILRRKTAEGFLEKSGGNSRKLFEESRSLQKHLRHLTHHILTSQEDKRKKVSHDLQDEIAQTLLGINVRLLTLKKEAATNAKGFKKDIASTQRLVDKAGRTVRRFAREIRKRETS